MEIRQRLLQQDGAVIIWSPKNTKILKQLQGLMDTVRYTIETLGPAATTQQVGEAVDITAQFSE